MKRDEFNVERITNEGKNPNFEFGSTQDAEFTSYSDNQEKIRDEVNDNPTSNDDKRPKKEEKRREDKKQQESSNKNNSSKQSDNGSSGSSASSASSSVATNLSQTILSLS